jgi:hypothetical protein
LNRRRLFTTFTSPLFSRHIKAQNPQSKPPGKTPPDSLAMNIIGNGHASAAQPNRFGDFSVDA